PPSRRHPHSFPTRRSSDLAIASRSPFGANASPPTVDGTSNVFSSPLGLRTKAVLPADHATVPSLCRATLSIQRRLASIATVEIRSEEHTSELQSRFDLVCR